MVKARFTTLDLRAVVTEIRSRVTGMRVANIYDLDSKTYLFKFAQSEEKVFLLIESGIRIHSTQFERSKSNSPSGFAMKLRKHLRTRRLTDMRQLGADRVVDLQFGSGEAAYHVIVELYDKGNIVLTDSELRILSLLRTRTTDEDVRIAVGEVYPVAAARGETVMNDAVLCELLSQSSAEHTVAVGDEAPQGALSLKKLLTAAVGYGSSIVEHCIIKAGLDPSAKLPIPHLVPGSASFLALRDSLVEAKDLMDAADRHNSKGFIFTSTKSVNAEGGPLYESFEPVVLLQDADRPHIAFDSFDRAVDEYFSRIEGQRIDVRAAQQEAQASKRIGYLRRENEQRIEGLRKAQDEDAVRGRAIEAAGDTVGRAIAIVCGAVARAMQWEAISAMVEEAKAARDPVALAITALRLDSNAIAMSLPDPDAENANEARRVRVDIDLGLSAHANARRYFDKRRHAAEKERKTVEQSGKAMKSAEQKTRKAAKAAATATSATIVKMRKPFWFEKFVWFVSSDNYLVIAGRDMQQNELIVGRHLKKGDIYVHADLSGAASCVVKNPSRDGSIPPPRTLQEAGSLAVCCSAAWDAKIVTGAWWVHDDQVSKTPPTGEYLPTGSFMIRGKKNFLPPAHLVLGFGFLFRLEDGSVAAHAGERKAVDTEPLAAIAHTVVEAEEAAEELNDDEATDSTASGDEAFPDTRVAAVPTNLPATDGSDAEGEGDDAPVGSLVGKSEQASRHVSAKERRDIKKASASGSAPQSTTGTRSAKTTPPPTETPQSQRQVRGKKGKLKKIKEKYADQDEEERALRMSLLQSVGSKKTATSDDKTAAKKRSGAVGSQPSQNAQAAHKHAPAVGCTVDLATAGRKPPEHVSRVLALDVQPADTRNQEVGDRASDESRSATDCTSIVVETAAYGTEAGNALVRAHIMGSIDNAVDGAASDGPEDEADGAGDEAESAGDVPDDQGDDGLLNALTGAPLANDELLFAVPVCAPYSAMSAYKFRVKLTPGITKKGKAAKAALNAFIQNREATARERDLMKGVRDTDLFLNIPGKVKVVVPVKAAAGRR
eukprot:Opistho-2@81013